ncbi:MAG: ATP-binding protein [Microcoleaceae cyanobacterium]
MFKFGQSSFRRILLSRILLLSVPVLLVGEYVTYRKARSGLLDTARLNLTESAVQKAEEVRKWVNVLQSSLMLAAENTVLQSPKSENYQAFLAELQQQLPTEIDINCLQLTNIQTQQPVASTCENQAIAPTPENFWLQQQPPERTLGFSNVYVRLDNTISAQNQNPQTPWRNQINLVLMAPVYLTQGESRQLRYALTLQSTLHLAADDRPKSLSGFTVVLDQNGKIIAHPSLERVGRNIAQEADANRLQNLVRRALDGEIDFIHLFSFEESDVELLAGYDAIPSPITGNNDNQWVILAVASLEDALSGLEDVKSILFYLTFSLILASIIAALYLSRDLAKPLEQLRDYALTVNSLESPTVVPKNLKIHEFVQMGKALEVMVERLKLRAEALEFASREASVANQLKSEFLRVVSHELRTPLNGIINSLQLLIDDFCDDRNEELEYLNMANKSALSLYEIVNDILEIALIQEGKLSIKLENIDLSTTLKDIINLTQYEIQQKGLKLNLELLETPITVVADQDKLKQVFLNIISNAIKFTSDGTITVLTQIQTHSSTQEQVIIKIQDTGMGVAEEKQKKLFQPFVLVDGSTTREFGGIGLGLALSRSLMQMMDGWITLESPGINQGTTVTITLPLAQTNPQQPQAKQLNSVTY